MRRALAIDERSYGPDHPEVAINLNNLALLLKATNRLAEAEPLMRRALAIDEPSYGPDHPKFSIRLNNLAQLLKDTNRLGEAELLMRRALAIDERSYRPDHPNVARDLNNLALLLQDTNRLGEAEPLLRRSVQVCIEFQRRTGYEHPQCTCQPGQLPVSVAGDGENARADRAARAGAGRVPSFRGRLVGEARCPPAGRLRGTRYTAARSSRAGSGAPRARPETV
jgi:tetratricopeptide (TPR) repeat protein